MAVTETWVYDCDVCDLGDSGYDSEHAALKAELAHLERCRGCSGFSPPGPEVIAAKRRELREFEAGVRSG